MTIVTAYTGDGFDGGDNLRVGFALETHLAEETVGERAAAEQQRLLQKRFLFVSEFFVHGLVTWSFGTII